jgi:diguanylate cyclase (GGDEF)-like protein
MRESLHDRLRPFKPYDLAFALVILALVAIQIQEATAGERLLIIVFGSLLFGGLEFVQHLVPVPTPLWQSLLVVCVNTAGLTYLEHFEGVRRFTLGFYMLNIAFATVAFGQRMGITAAVLSVLALATSDLVIGKDLRPWTEWALFFAILMTLVAILLRISRLQQDALFDVVTGLRNHRYFQVRLREEIQRTDRNARPTGLIFFDLDNFKSINDRFGHAVGDYVLGEVSRVLEANARSSDIVCRYGGEEVAVILPETTVDEAMNVAERLRQAVERRNDQPGPAVTVSAGVASYPANADSSDLLIAQADAALYAAKRAGKNRIVSAPLRVAERSVASTSSG